MTFSGIFLDLAKGERCFPPPPSWLFLMIPGGEIELVRVEIAMGLCLLGSCGSEL